MRDARPPARPVRAPAAPRARVRAGGGGGGAGAPSTSDAADASTTSSPMTPAAESMNTSGYTSTQLGEYTDTSGAFGSWRGAATIGHACASARVCARTGDVGAGAIAAQRMSGKSESAPATCGRPAMSNASVRCARRSCKQRTESTTLTRSACVLGEPAPPPAETSRYSGTAPHRAHPPGSRHHRGGRPATTCTAGPRPSHDAATTETAARDAAAATRSRHTSPASTVHNHYHTGTDNTHIARAHTHIRVRVDTAATNAHVHTSTHARDRQGTRAAARRAHLIDTHNMDVPRRHAIGQTKPRHLRVRGRASAHSNACAGRGRAFDGGDPTSSSARMSASII